AGVGQRAAAGTIQALLTGTVAYIVWELTSLWINAKLAAERTASATTSEHDDGGEGGGAGGSRLSTVLPLARAAIKIAILVVAVLLALGELGVNIAPLLAGAGIAGLAIGFGAQKLVADVVSGVFFLLDDAFRTGEYLEVAGTFGTVERISIRSIQLRHHEGAVHTIPYGEMQKITNFSRDWVILKMKFTVPFDTDPNLVKKIFKRIGADLAADPEHGPNFLQPFKSQGVFDIDDVGMVLRGKFAAKPGTQFTLRKEIYLRVKAAFEANGIAFARREVKVTVARPDHDDEPLTPEELEAATAAANEVVPTAEPAAKPA
ncbi:MAG: mechanosensitive ion channel family protein, partial [Pseudomonadota bacterium]